jgi:hypothetical protein
MAAVEFVYSIVLEVRLLVLRVVIEQSTRNSANRKDIIKRCTQVDNESHYLLSKPAIIKLIIALSCICIESLLLGNILILRICSLAQYSIGNKS